jgi:hypothetical protein
MLSGVVAVRYSSIAELATEFSVVVGLAVEPTVEFWGTTGRRGLPEVDFFHGDRGAGRKPSSLVGSGRR